ncbi:MAG: diguanylate cyclase [Chloroflexi bacterium]|nr:diguanylate cyclase [Chloroflexota bacterium]
MEFRMFLQAIQRGWLIIVVTALTALIVALASSYLIAPTYEATARLVVSPNFARVSDADLIDSLATLDNRSIVATYAEVVSSTTVFDTAVNTIGFPESELENYKTITLVLPEANIMEISVEGPVARKTALLANSIGQEAISFVNNLYSVYQIDFLDPATAPLIPKRPQPLRDGILALALGIVIGAILAVIRGQLSTPLEAFLARSQVDSVSTAYNRRFFEDKLDDLVAGSPTAHAALSLINLDGLEYYLQVLPQPIVQQLLRRTTDIIRSELRGNDIIGKWDDVTFSVLLSDTPGKAAVSTMGRVQASLSKPMRFSPDGESIQLRPKIGIGERLQGDQASLVIGRAEEALEEATHDETGLVLHKTRALIGF